MVYNKHYFTSFYTIFRLDFQKPMPKDGIVHANTQFQLNGVTRGKAGESTSFTQVKEICFKDAFVAKLFC
jgi:hypothetical protein